MGSESAILVSVAKAETGETGFIGRVHNGKFRETVSDIDQREGPVIGQSLEFGNFPFVVLLMGACPLDLNLNFFSTVFLKFQNK